MKSLMMSVLFVAGMILGNTAHAEKFDVLTIGSNVDGNDTETLEVEMNGGAITNIHFKGKAYDVARIAKRPATVISKSGVAVVEFLSENVKSTSFTLVIRYLYEYKLIGSDRRTKKITVAYDSGRKDFELKDRDTGKTIKNAYTHVRVVNGKEKGIDRIDTW